jgi:hypothetical protein
MRHILIVAAGLSVGYMVASMAESIQHRVFGHAPQALRQLWRKHPTLFGWLRWTWWSHAVVHHSTASGRWFCSPESRYLPLLCRMTPRERYIAVRTTFGLTITLNSFGWFMWLPMATLPLLWMLLGTLGAVAAFLPMLLPPLLSMTVHPYIHRPYHNAIDDASVAVRWLLRTWYGRMMIRHHWLHHRHPTINFNLLLGGDWVLGTARPATEKEAGEMYAQGLRLD